MFTQPPHCPNPDCPHHTDGAKGFYARKGSYRTKHDHQLVRRYQCKKCGRRFNSRTFSPTARQHKPEVNRLIMGLLCSGVTMRRAAKLAGVARRTMERRFRWLAEQARKAHEVFLSAEGSKTSYVQFDEMETREGSKLRPLSIALAVRAKTGQIIDAQVATKRCSGHLAKKGGKAHPNRVNTREAACTRVVESVRQVAKPQITIASDEKSAYPGIIKAVIKDAIFVPYKSRGNATAKAQAEPEEGEDFEIDLQKKAFDPMFRLNHMAAKLRADISRLARRTWSISKRQRGMQDHLAIYIAYNNGYAIA